MLPLMKFLPMVTITSLLGANLTAAGMPAGFNDVEEKVPAYVLPTLMPKDLPAAAWAARRQEILAQLEREEYGKSPPLPAHCKTKISLAPGPACGGKAIRKQVTVYFSADEAGPSMDILIYTPADAKGPVPIFWGLNFTGNHSVEADPAIPLARSWMPDDNKGKATANHRATEAGRGKGASRWQIETALAAGYGVATAYYGDIVSDVHDNFKSGVFTLFPEIEAKRDGTTWGAVAAWAWGMRVGMDYFSTDPAIDPKRVMVMGHSRLGKTALWAGATDERFAIVISNDSGAGGAALHSRIFGETINRINTSFPHWFCRNFSQYNDKEPTLTFDQHFLLAIIAPRPLLVCSATEDLWADPRGEYLAAWHASPAYELLGQKGLASEASPAPDTLVKTRVGYNLRTGSHDVTLADWQAYVAFAQQHLPKP